MGDAYDPNEETKSIIYLDVVNLYGWAMTQYLPYKDFTWVSNREMILNKNFFNVPDDNEYGYIVECDLEYGEHLHDAHKDLPLLPHHFTAPGSKDEKLMTTLYDKEKYVIHYRALKQAIKHGIVVKNIHRAICFRQKAWLKPFIEFNSEKRKHAKNDFEKHLYKLLNNSIYGKTMEDETKRVNVKLVTHWDGVHGAEVLIARPNFKSCSIFKENLVAVEMAVTEVTITKPIYVGLSVLDISKTRLYRFHYEYIKERLDSKALLLYTDTDSLIYEITDEDIYKMIKNDIHEFDTSAYPEDNQFEIPRVNAKKVGLMSDECAGNIILEFVGAKSKAYSLRIMNKDDIKKCKGITSNVIQRTLTFDHYKKCVLEKCIQSREQSNIRSKLHVVQTLKHVKVALTPFDDKRHLLEGSTNTLPHGHYSIVNDDWFSEEFQANDPPPPPQYEQLEDDWFSGEFQGPPPQYEQLEADGLLT